MKTENITIIILAIISITITGSLIFNAIRKSKKTKCQKVTKK
ncbi:MAG: hypothetical protein RL705_1002 [Bacteroidota bacterium]|jgi:hypothetical protein